MIIGIPIHEKVDLLDVAAPYEIFNLRKFWPDKNNSKLASKMAET
jgi:hypothetical protein